MTTPNAGILILFLNDLNTWTCESMKWAKGMKAD
jgi:hypothetical protein